MPKKGEPAAKARSPKSREKRRVKRSRGDDWLPYAVAAAQLVSSVTTLIEAIRR